MPTPMDRMNALLSLNKDQKKQVKTIMDDGQKEATPVRDQMLKGRETIAQAVAAGKSQDEINAAINEYAAAQTQMTLIELRAFTKIFQSLEKDQQAKAPGMLPMMSGIFKGKNWDSNPSSN
jgi:Spy/CpxP family protein refolding chaperone